MTEESERYLELGQQGAITTEVMVWSVGAVLLLSVTFPIWKHLIFWPWSGERRKKRH